MCSLHDHRDRFYEISSTPIGTNLWPWPPSYFAPSQPARLSRNIRTFTNCRKATVLYTNMHTHTEWLHTDIFNRKRFEQIELLAKLPGYFLWSNKSNINQSIHTGIFELSSWGHSLINTNSLYRNLPFHLVVALQLLTLAVYSYTVCTTLTISTDHTKNENPYRNNRECLWSCVSSDSTQHKSALIVHMYNILRMYFNQNSCIHHLVCDGPREQSYTYKKCNHNTECHHRSARN